MKRARTPLYYFLGALLIVIVAFLFNTHTHVAWADTVDVNVTVAFFECNDGIDNDADGLIDFPNDPGCTEASDDDETDPQCVDGIDNDGDGLTDFPDDPGCDDANDNDETNAVLPPASGGGSISGSIGIVDAATRVIFTGLAHPGSRVVLLKDAIVAAETTARLDARFSMSLTNMTIGDYVFTLYGTDTDGVRSGLVSFTMTIPESFLVEISDIFIPPTIYIADNGDEEEISLSGRTVPNAPVTVAMFSKGDERNRFETVADLSGRYTGSFIDEVFRAGDTPIKSFAVFENLTSPFGAAAALLSVSRDMMLPGDFNRDRRVDLVDFSMLAFWYKRADTPAMFDLNDDGIVDLVDVSIMVSHWTG